MSNIQHAINAQPAVAKVGAIAAELGVALVEREAVVRGALLALVARQHVLLLGAPGTGKSMLVRALTERITGATRFETLLTKFSTPEEVFGPLSIAALQEDRYARVLDGRLPTAHVAFVDEVGKASSAILNALLAVMADRIFHDDARAVPCPLVTLFGASNEIPSGDELAALYDRFLLRFEVRALSDAGFTRMVAADAPAAGTTLDFTELAALQAAATAVAVPGEIVEALGKLRAELREQGVTASDRRWRASLDLIKASAVLDGRTQAAPDDVEVLTDVLWSRPEDRALVAKAVARVGNPVRARVAELIDQATDVHAETAALLGGGDADAVQRAAMAANSRLKGILHELGHLRDANSGAEAARIEAAIDKVRDLNGDVVRRGFGL